MRKITIGSLSLTSVLIVATLLGLDSQLALACSGGGSSSSGLSHGSSLGSGSVTVCVGSSSSSPSSSTTKTITKTVKVPVKVKTPAPVKKVGKPAPKKPAKPVVKAPVACPSSAQLSKMPSSADASARWVKSVCSPPVSRVAAPKPASKPPAKSKTKTITETITISIPGYRSQASDAVQFFPNPLIASVYPAKVLSIGQVALFSSNPSAHYGSARVLGRQAEVHFVPDSSGWYFSDGDTRTGSDASKSFDRAGVFQVSAFVDYSVRYRLLGETSWQRVPGKLTVASNTLEILVSATGIKDDKASKAGLLVGQDCSQNPGSFGCDT